MLVLCVLYCSYPRGPIFFYTGNESPVGEYVNNTGLMWELGERLGALLVFAEHRFFGLSVPRLQGMACVEELNAYMMSGS